MHAALAELLACLCGGAKLVTWYYDEEHMPTGYLMNALVTVPDAVKDAVTGLCHGTTGDDANLDPRCPESQAAFGCSTGVLSTIIDRRYAFWASKTEIMANN